MMKRASMASYSPLESGMISCPFRADTQKMQARRTTDMIRIFFISEHLSVFESFHVSVYLFLQFPCLVVRGLGIIESGDKAVLPGDD